MGFVLSTFRRKLSTKQQLEKIQLEIERLEDYKWSTLRSQKNIIGLLFFVSGLIYVLVAFSFYFYYLPRADTWQDKLIHTVPLIILPAIVYLLKRALQWYYRWDLDSKEDKLITLRKEKKKILEKVMETETYKVAKELLEKYDPSALKEKTETKSALNMSMNSSNVSNLYLRQRINTPSSTSLYQKSPMPRYGMKALPPTPAANMSNNAFPMRTPPPPVPRLARPIVQANRTVVEKLVDYVVGDGPSNRYALICNVCKSHNGMALKDEFEYLAFRCCFCLSFNPARKQRPFAPRLLSSQQASQSRPTVDEPESDSEVSKQESETKTSVDIVELTAPENTKDDNDEGKREESDVLPGENPKSDTVEGEEEKEDDLLRNDVDKPVLM